MSVPVAMAQCRYGSSPGDVLGSCTSDLLGNGPCDDLCEDLPEDLPDGLSDCSREGLGNAGVAGAVP